MNKAYQTTFTVNLITPQNKLTIKNVLHAQIPTNDGVEMFLPNHQHDSYLIKPGLCSIKSQDQQIKELHLEDGHAKFEDNILDITVVSLSNLQE